MLLEGSACFIPLLSLSLLPSFPLSLSLSPPLSLLPFFPLSLPFPPLSLFLSDSLTHSHIHTHTHSHTQQGCQVIRASASGEVDTVNSLLQSGVDPNFSDIFLVRVHVRIIVCQIEIHTTYTCIYNSDYYHSNEYVH